MSRSRGTTGAVRRGKARHSALGVGGGVAGGGVGSGGGGTSGITELTGDVTAGPGSGSVVATIGADKVTTAKILDANVTTAKLAAASVTTVKIADAAVTSAKLRDSAALSVIGRSANSSGVPADIVAATNGHVLQRLANVLGFSALDISAFTDGTITLAKLVDLAALSVLGRAANTSGVMAAITAANDAEVLRRSGTALGFGTIATGGVADAAITLAKLANMATQTLIGRNTGSTGVPEAVTLTQLLDWISGSVTKGDILVRDTASWTRLAAPAIGFFLGGNGTGALPSYQGVIGFAHPLAQNSHLEYAVSTALSLANNRGGAGGLTGTTITYPAAGSIDASGPYFQLGTGGTTNTSASATSQTSGAFKDMSFAWDFDLTFVVKTDASAITNVRYLLGVGINNENADTVAGNFIGFRYSTSVPDGGWVGIVYDGTQVVTATVAAIAANTRYVMRIRKVGSSVFFSVNSSAEVSPASHVPVNNVYASIVQRVVTLSNNVRSLWFSRLWVDFGV